MSKIVVSGIAFIAFAALSTSAAVAEISIHENTAGTQFVHIFGKQDDPIPLPHFAAVTNTPLPQILNPNGDANGDIRADITSRAGGPWVAAWSYWDGTDYEIAYSEWDGNQWTAMLLLTNNADDDLDVSIALDGSGRPIVAYWRDEATSSVYSRRRFSSGTWEGECLISIGVNPAIDPKVTIGPNTKPWISYDVVIGAQREVRVAWDNRSFPQELPNFVHELLDQSTFTESTEPEIMRRNGHMWVSWIHDGSQMGWSERVQATWTAPAFEPYSDPDDIEAARFRIQRQVSH